MSNSSRPTPSSDSSSPPESDASPASERLRLEVDVLRGARLAAPPEEEASAASDASPADGSIDDEDASSPGSGALGVLLVLVLSLASLVGGTVPAHAQIFVDADANGANDGSSWSDAYTNLQDALNGATGSDEIWLAAGTYYPDRGANVTADDPDASFTLTGATDGLTIYGGFAGTETSRDQRDPATNRTVLSGDVDGNDAAFSPYADTDGDGVTPTQTDHINGTNSYHVVQIDGRTNGPVTSATVLDGLTITAGRSDVTSDGNQDAAGGGIECIARGNDTECSPTLRNLVVVGNHALGGGGLLVRAFNGGKATPSLTNVTFAHNAAIEQELNGGGGGAMEFVVAGGVGDVQFVNAVFLHNVASSTGGAIIAGHTTINSSPSVSPALDVTLVNATFTQNKLVDEQNSSLLVRCTDPSLSCTAQMTNTVVWDEDAGTTPIVVDEASLTVSHSLVEGGLDASVAGGYVDGGGNLAGDPGDDPQLVVFSTDTYPVRLSAATNAVDAGTNEPFSTGGVASSVTTDPGGEERIQNGTVDLGAYEGGLRYYVNGASGSDTNDGTAWGSAFATLTHALSVVPGNAEIWVATGTYTTGPDRTDAFTIVGHQNGLRLFGGFAGTETALSERDLSTGATVLSGDIGVSGDASDNAYTVVFMRNSSGIDITGDTILDGFTLTGGNANGARSSPSEVRGGGLYCEGGSGTCAPTLTNLVIRDNHASDDGGGIYNFGFTKADSDRTGTSSPIITNTVFLGNTATDCGGAIGNKGLSGVSNPVLTNVTFSGNTAGEEGGAMCNIAETFFSLDTTPESRPTVINTIIWGNSAPSGAVIYNDNADPSLRHTLVEGGLDGAGIVNDGGSTVTDDGGNFDADPRFVDADGSDDTFGTLDDDVTLRELSPAIGAGDNDALPAGITTDLAGNDRVQKDRIDLGALESPFEEPAIHVDANATGTNDGTSWVDAFTDLQDALAVADSDDQIWIRAGTYKPASADRTVSFTVTGEDDGLKIYGGFAGTESTLDERDLSANETILSGDIGTEGDASDNSYHVVEFDGTTNGPITTATVLSDVTVTAGNADGASPDNRGGGLYCGGNGSGNQCTPVIKNVVFTENAAAVGGAIYNFGDGGRSSPRIVNVVFAGNTATLFGGAIVNNGNSGGTSRPQITNATFSSNIADDKGGALYNSGNSGTSEPRLTNVILSGNTASNGGDEVYNVSATPLIAHSLVRGSGGSGSWDTSFGSDSGNNIDADPQFAVAGDPDGADDTYATDDDGLRLLWGSPAIDAGDERANGLSEDLTGAARVQSGTVDMGAYEATPDPAETIYVDASATGGNDGSDWSNAYSRLQDALAAATLNDEIWIAGGTYTPGSNRGDSFTIVGSQDGLKIYGGFAGTESTLADRDLEANETILSGDIGTPSNSTDNSYHVLVFDGTRGEITTATVLSDVTVTAGNADGSSPKNRGGGLYCIGNGSGNECSPNIVNTAFVGNAAEAGGAIYNFGDGGTSSPPIVGSIFTGNTATLFGGAIVNNGNNGGTSSPPITNATFTGNSADDNGGAINNSAVSGGTSAPQITNTILWGNTAGAAGNEVYNAEGEPTISHSLVQGSGGSGSWDTGLGTDGGNNLDADPQFVDPTDPDGADDTFATGDDGLLVGPSSPAVDAGNNSAIPSGITADLLGTARTQDGDGDGTATVSLGAYEILGNPTTTSLSIDGTDGTGNDRGWRLLGVPHASTTAGALRLTHANGTTTPRLDDGVVALWDDSAAPDQDGDPTGGFFRADASTPLSAGPGFLLFLLDDDMAPVDGAAGLSLSVEDDGAALQPPEPVDADLTASARWHLVANPHPTSYRLNALTVGGQSLPTSGFQADVQIYDAPTQTWQLRDASTTDRVAPWQGFFLERSTPGSGPTTVTFEPQGRTQGAPFVGSKSEAAGALARAKRGEIGLRVTATRSASDTTVLARDDAAALRFHERATPGFDAFDASKLDPLADTFVTLAPVGPARGDSLTAKAIESRPWFADTTRSNSSGTDPAVIPLRLRSEGLPEDAGLAVSARTWTLPEGWTARLTDTRGTRRSGDDRQVALTAETVYETTRRSTAADTARFVVSVRRSEAALPVELSGFDARMDDGAVHLAWETASETGNAGFEVQRKEEGKSGSEGAWERIGFLEGAGTTDTPQSYRFLDTGVPYATERLTYRLRQVDTDGAASFSEPITVARGAPAQVELQGAFPNPVRSRTTIRYTLPRATEVHLVIYDALGRRVQTLVDEEQPAGRKQLTLDTRQLSRLASGTYFYRLTAGETTRTRKLTIVR